MAVTPFYNHNYFYSGSAPNLKGVLVWGSLNYYWIGGIHLLLSWVLLFLGSGIQWAGAANTGKGQSFPAEWRRLPSLDPVMRPTENVNHPYGFANGVHIGYSLKTKDRGKIRGVAVEGRNMETAIFTCYGT